jgi:hypothetical protein
MPIDDEDPGENPAITFLTKQRDGYAATLKRLTAQHKGVEAKMFSTQAKLEATEEALKALAPKTKTVDSDDPNPQSMNTS